MQLLPQIDRQAFDALAPDVQACYQPDGEGFTLHLEPPQSDGAGPKLADVLACGRRRDNAAKVLHRQIVGQELKAAGLPAEKCEEVIKATRCIVNEDGAVDVLILDGDGNYRISARPGEMGLMSLTEFMEGLKPEKAKANSNPPRFLDEIVKDETVKGHRVVRLRSGAMLIDGRPAETAPGSVLMGIGSRPQATETRRDVHVTAKEAEGLTGPQLMRKARGETVHPKASPTQFPASKA